MLYVRARHVLKGTYRTLLKYSFLKTDRRATEVHKRERLDEKFENPLKTNKQTKKVRKKRSGQGWEFQQLDSTSMLLEQSLIGACWVGPMWVR